LTAWDAPKGKAAHGSARGGDARSAHVVSTRSGGGHSFDRLNRTLRSTHLSVARARTHAAERSTVTRSRAALGSEGARSSRGSSHEAGTAQRNYAALNRERNITRANDVRTSRMQEAQARNARISQATRNT